MARGSDNKLFKIMILVLSLVTCISLSVASWALTETISHGKKIAALESAQTEKSKSTTKFETYVKGEFKYLRRRINVIANGRLSGAHTPHPEDN
jgi:hypothetical protein